MPARRSVVALIPARAGSKGVRHKNSRCFDPWSNESLTERAIAAAHEAGCDRVVVTTDSPAIVEQATVAAADVIHRPKALATDTTSMNDVVRHALTVISPMYDVVLLLQPTSPLRTRAQLHRALRLLTDYHRRHRVRASVASVVPIPQSHAPGYVCRRDVDGFLELWRGGSWSTAPTRRQDTEPAYARDGTVYAFWASTFREYGHIYGPRCVPLILKPTESCSIDTWDDWRRAQQMLGV